MTESRQQPSQVAVFFGWLLMAVGGLIALTAGACSLLFVASMFGNRPGFDGLIEMIPLILIFGGVPFAVGTGLVIVGRRISKPRVTGRD